MGGGRRDVIQEIVWVVNHWMNWNNCLIYEVEVLNQTIRMGVLQGESIGIKSPQDRRQVIIGLRPQQWARKLGSGREGRRVLRSTGTGWW